jgi:hypothetical protein
MSVIHKRLELFRLDVRPMSNNVQLPPCSVILRDAQAELDSERMYRVPKKEDEGMLDISQSYHRP